MGRVPSTECYTCVSSKLGDGEIKRLEFSNNEDKNCHVTKGK